MALEFKMPIGPNIVPNISVVPITRSETVGENEYSWVDYGIDLIDGMSVEAVNGTFDPTTNIISKPSAPEVYASSIRFNVVLENGHKREIKLPVNWNKDIVPNAHNYKFRDHLDTLLQASAGGEDAMKVFSSIDYDRKIFVRNPNLWCGSAIMEQLTGCLAYKAFCDERYGGIMITDQHFLCCAHSHPHASNTWHVNNYGDHDARVWLVDKNNNTIERTHVGQGYVPPNDFMVGVLDTPVPSDIHIIQYADFDTDDLYNVTNTSGYYGIVVGQGRNPALGPWEKPGGYLIRPDTGEKVPASGFVFGAFADYGNPGPAMVSIGGTMTPKTHFPWDDPPANLDADAQASFLKARRFAYDGDSGTPSFYSIEGTLYFAAIISGSTASLADTDKIVSEFDSEFIKLQTIYNINKAIAAADAQAVGFGRLAAPTGKTISLASNPLA